MGKNQCETNLQFVKISFQLYQELLMTLRFYTRLKNTEHSEMSDMIENLKTNNRLSTNCSSKQTKGPVPTKDMQTSPPQF